MSLFANEMCILVFDTRTGTHTHTHAHAEAGLLVTLNNLAVGATGDLTF